MYHVCQLQCVISHRGKWYSKNNNIIGKHRSALLLIQTILNATYHKEYHLHHDLINKHIPLENTNNSPLHLSHNIMYKDVLKPYNINQLVNKYNITHATNIIRDRYAQYYYYGLIFPPLLLKRSVMETAVDWYHHQLSFPITLFICKRYRWLL